MAHEHRLVQVLVHILTNADHAVIEVHGCGTHTVRAEVIGGNMRISATDDGPGISEEHLPEVFDPFFTIKEVGKGTGLGLGTCYGILVQHGGRILAESTLGQGANFYVGPPIIRPEGERPSPEITGSQSPALSQRILVVDDEPDIRDLLSEVLTREQYNVTLAANGEEAWRMMAQDRFDCVFLDLKMPGMSGQQLYQLIHASDSRLARRVVFVTGAMLSPDIEEFVADTGNSVLSKPFRLEDLRSAVRTSIDS